MINTMEELARLRQQNAELTDKVIDLTIRVSQLERAKDFFRDDAIRFRFLLEAAMGEAPPLGKLEP